MDLPKDLSFSSISYLLTIIFNYYIISPYFKVYKDRDSLDIIINLSITTNILFKPS